MKKIILLVVLTTLGMSLNSCSSDDSGSSASSSKITATIDGVVTTFDKVTVTLDKVSAAPDVIANISATKGNDLSEVILIRSWQGQAGTNNPLNDLSYVKDDISYQDTSDLNLTIITNSEHELTGTFSGKVKTNGSPNLEKTITSGSISIKY